MSTKKWTQADGAKVRIKDMDDAHLVNTILFVERRHERIVADGYAVLSSLSGEMAQLDVELGLRSLENNGPSESEPLYDDLCEEARRRGLTGYSRYTTEEESR